MGICTPMRKYGPEIDYGKGVHKGRPYLYSVMSSRRIPNLPASDTKQELHAVFAVDDMDQRSFP